MREPPIAEGDEDEEGEYLAHALGFKNIRHKAEVLTGTEMQTFEAAADRPNSIPQLETSLSEFTYIPLPDILMSSNTSEEFQDAYTLSGPI